MLIVHEVWSYTFGSSFLTVLNGFGFYPWFRSSVSVSPPGCPGFTLGLHSPSVLVSINVCYYTPLLRPPQKYPRCSLLRVLVVSPRLLLSSPHDVHGGESSKPRTTWNEHRQIASHCRPGHCFDHYIHVLFSCTGIGSCALLSAHFRVRHLSSGEVRLLVGFDEVRVILPGRVIRLIFLLVLSSLHDVSL